MKERNSIYFLIILGLLFNVHLAVAGATRTDDGIPGIEFIKPLKEDKVTTLPAYVKIKFNIPIDLTTFKASLNGKDVTGRFTVSAAGARAFLSISDGLRTKAGKEGQIFASNLIKVDALDVNSRESYQANTHFLIETSGVAAGGAHTITLKDDGTVWGWGENGNGQLGDGTTINRHTPDQVNGLTGIIAVASGYSHNLGTLSIGISLSR